MPHVVTSSSPSSRRGGDLAVWNGSNRGTDAAPDADDPESAYPNVRSSSDSSSSV